MSSLGLLGEFTNFLKIHPILVNLSVAIVSISVLVDCVATSAMQDITLVHLRKESLHNASWWALFFAVIITPFTAITGWLYWRNAEAGAEGVAVHKWLAAAIPFLLVGLFFWRQKFIQNKKSPNVRYLAIGLLFVIALFIQG
jgi:uncharacterized membrane protein